MQTRIRKSCTFSFLTAGLIALSGVFTVAPFVSAQTGQECPLPAGLMNLADLPVTAQQVDNGSASLMEFAQASADHYSALHQNVTTFEESLQVQCLTRQLGSTWRSDSTYLVFLTLDGRVFQHAKAMALSGRLLNPVIYGAILQALGINPADLADPASARAAIAAAAAGGGGSFSVPNIPGASGYAVLYAGIGSPLSVACRVRSRRRSPDSHR